MSLSAKTIMNYIMVVIGSIKLSCFRFFCNGQSFFYLYHPNSAPISVFHPTDGAARIFHIKKNFFPISMISYHLMPRPGIKLTTVELHLIEGTSYRMHYGLSYRGRGIYWLVDLIKFLLPMSQK